MHLEALTFGLPTMNVAARLIGFLSLCFLLLADQIEISSYEESQQESQSSANVIGRIDERTSALHFFKESIHELSSRDDLAVRGRARQDYLHDVVFVIQQRNMDELTRILDDISNPLSPNYGHHLSNRKIADMTSNVEGRDAVIEQLDAHGAVVISETLHGDYITARAPISVWEKMFNTQFYRFHQMQHTGAIDELIRAKEYSIPVELRDHVESVFNTIQMPLIVHGHLPVPHLMDIPEGTNIHTDAYSLPGFTTPAKIKAYYNIGTTVGSASSTQGVFSTIGQYFSPADLSYFQKYMGLPNQPVANSLGGYSSDTECAKDTSVCSEGNLDVQYIMAVSPESPTTYWYTNLIFSDWMVSVANTANPPLVFSISYGSEESTLSKSELTAFNTQIIKLSAQGITFFAAAGDDGALSRYVRTKGSSSCGYAPLFPASNPYVVSVGATSVSVNSVLQTKLKYLSNLYYRV